MDEHMAFARLLDQGHRILWDKPLLCHVAEEAPQPAIGPVYRDGRYPPLAQMVQVGPEIGVVSRGEGLPLASRKRVKPPRTTLYQARL